MLSAPILATKLYIPAPRPERVPRPRLIEQLQAGLHRKLSLISAPAGFGKTTLLSSLIHDLKFTIGNGGRAASNDKQPVHRAAWLSLDEGDNDPSRFLAYLVAALQTISPNIGEDVQAALQASQPPPTDMMLTALLNDIITIPDNFILVLDDYHVIEAKPVDKALTFLLEHLPPHMHLIIATREDPPLPLARFRVRGQLTEVRAADLRFTPAEAATFLNQMMDLNLSAGDIAALETRTEGWIAGLQLAALALQGTISRQESQDASHFIESFRGSHRFVLDYLAEEVLHQQPAAVQTFLLQTSILERMCGPLCDAVCSTEIAGLSGQEILESLERANLFLIPLDNERRWYRYHQLFADLLRQRLHQQAAASTAGEERVLVDLHQRASRWYELNDSASEAFQHALAAHDFDRAARLAELSWSAMDQSRQSARWLEWVKALPDELIQTRPVLSVGYAWALLDNGHLEAAEARLQDAEPWLATTRLPETPDTPSSEMIVVDQELFQSLPATIATARAYLAQAHGDTPATVTYARQALDLLPEDDHLQRGIAGALLGLAYWASEELEAAHRAFTEAMANFQAAGNVLFAITGIPIQADIKLAQGKLQEAVQTYQQTLQLTTEQDESLLRGTADLYTRLSELSCEQNNLEIAKQQLLTSKKLGEHALLPRWRFRWCVAQARFNEVLGNLDAALDQLNEAEQLYIRGPVPDVRPIAALKARLWIAQGNLAMAQAWANEQALSVTDDLSYLREFEHITLARLLITRYKREQEGSLINAALALLKRLLQAAEKGGRSGSMIEILVQQALANEAQGNLTTAHESLARALTLAEPEGYIRIFVDEGRPMARLLSTVATQGIVPDYIARLLTVFETEEQPDADKSILPANLPNQALIEPLSQRELEVLQLIAKGLSNREIGERLFLALDTIKGHNRRIFGKLQVKRRTEAVAKARSLNILPPQ